MKLLSERLAHIYSERPDLEGERGQIGLVRASGASKSVVNQWLNDKIKSMDIRYALAIEASLGYSHVWLMAGIGAPLLRPGVAQTPQPVVERARVTLALPEELDLLDLYRRSTDRGKGDIVEAAQNARKVPVAGLVRNKA